SSNLRLKNKVAFIIPNYEGESDLKECVEAIHLNCQSNKFEIIIVDNASKGSVIPYLKSIENLPNVKVILNNENYGFTYAVNQGITIAEQHADLILLNNDAIVCKGAIEEMQHLAYS